ncbi:hypothetical protein HID58_005957, partial [Brassica napus]
MGIWTLSLWLNTLRKQRYDALQCIGEVKVTPSMPKVLSPLEKIPILRQRKTKSKKFATNSSSLSSKRFLRHT